VRLLGWYRVAVLSRLRACVIVVKVVPRVEV